MKQWFALTSCAALWLGSAGFACSADAPYIVRPDNLKWFGPPGNPGLQGAWVIGSEQNSGAYILRVKLAAGARMPPHIHPDERNSTVLSGTLYVGFGNTFDELKMIAIPTGGVYVAPATVAHYVWAKDGDVVYQEAGLGPTATTVVKP
ncbi:MAG: cupin domain-containing protein [Pseudomonadota bacterium]